jgi:hypothetical protein
MFILLFYTQQSLNYNKAWHSDAYIYLIYFYRNKWQSLDCRILDIDNNVYSTETCSRWSRIIDLFLQCDGCFSGNTYYTTLSIQFKPNRVLIWSYIILEEHCPHLEGRTIKHGGKMVYILRRGSVVVKALCCKPEGRGFKSRWGGFFKLT